MTGRNLLSLSFRVVSLAFAVVAAAVAVFTLTFVTRAVSASGVVTGYTQIQNKISVMPDSDQTGILYYPVVSYTTAGGHVGEVTGPSGRSAPQYQVGDEVPVLVSGSNPSDARIATLLGIWGTSLILGAIALIFLVLSLAAPFGFGGIRRAR